MHFRLRWVGGAVLQDAGKYRDGSQGRVGCGPQEAPYGGKNVDLEFVQAGGDL